MLRRLRAIAAGSWGVSVRWPEATAHAPDVFPLGKTGDHVATYRRYDADKDFAAANRTWREAGWSDGSKEQEEALRQALDTGGVSVCELDGAAECVVQTVPAAFRYLDEDIPMAAVLSVVTSLVGRRQGLGLRLTARSVAQAVQEGALVAGLGMFDQGYYNRIGFGTGSYAHQFGFDPAQLTVKVKPRTPRRLTPGDWQAMHAARLERPRGHGGLNILTPSSTRGAMMATRNAVGLGYFDGPGGSLSHALWAGARNPAHGPLHVHWLVYRTRDQFLELMALLKSLADQMRLVVMVEPPGIQLQDLLAWPFKQQQISEHSPFAAFARTRAWWQLRICDLPGCLARTHLPGPGARFSLQLSDPIAGYLDADAPWRGVAGEYVVSLGSSSSARPGTDPALPTLTATVNAFTRLWIGVRPASGLTTTGELAGPPELLAQLDRSLCLPSPAVDWDF